MTAAIRLRPRLAAGLLVAAGLLLTTAPAFSQRNRPVVRPEGSQAFRGILHSFPFHAEPLEEVAGLNQVPWDQTVLIVLGDTQVLDEVKKQTGGLTRFHQRGGTILIASDHEDHGRLADFKVKVSGSLVRQAVERAYRAEPACPIVTNFRDRKHPLFRGLAQGIATNQPSYLKEEEGCRLHLLASLADDLTAEGWPVFVPLPFLMGSSGSASAKGRVEILADPDVFTNQMMVNPDNYTFALNSLRWLTEGGRRKHVLFLEDGKVQASFDVPLAEMPPLPLPPTEVVNKLLTGLEEENRFNRLLLEYVGPAKLFQGILLGLTLLLALVLLRRLVLARHRLDPHLPLVARKVTLALAAPPVHALRREGLLRAGNLWETARALARECFDGHAVPAADPALLPSFAVAGSWWQRRRLDRLVRRLWQLAYSPLAVRVPPRQIRRVQQDAAILGAALEAGTVVFQAADRKANGQPGPMR